MTVFLKIWLWNFQSAKFKIIISMAILIGLCTLFWLILLLWSFWFAIRQGRLILFGSFKNKDILIEVPGGWNRQAMLVNSVSFVQLIFYGVITTWQVSIFKYFI